MIKKIQSTGDRLGLPSQHVCCSPSGQGVDPDPGLRGQTSRRDRREQPTSRRGLVKVSFKERDNNVWRYAGLSDWASTGRALEGIQA